MDFAIKSCAPGIHPDKDLDFENCLVKYVGYSEECCVPGQKIICVASFSILIKFYE